jgi:uncharacterized membrane protein HdeD (DUF308 family)
MADTAASPVAARAAYPWWATLIQGIATLVIGGLLLARPVSTTVLLVLIIGWFWLISGIIDIVSLFWDRAQWGWKLFSGILGIIVGGFIIGSPFIGAAALLGAYALLLGIGGIVYGIAAIVHAFQGAGWGRGILGFFSVIFGLVIAFNLVPAAAALPWVFGILGIIFGIAAIFMSFQIKKAQS